MAWWGLVYFVVNSVFTPYSLCLCVRISFVSFVVENKIKIIILNYEILDRTRHRNQMDWNCDKQ